MKPETESYHLLGVTRSKAKMFEYSVIDEHHIETKEDPAKLFIISIGLLGDIAATINQNNPDSADLLELKTNLLFAAHFFDSYLQSKLNEEFDPYLMLLCSASYYLCDLPGSASVLAKRIDGDSLDLDGDGLEYLLLWLLQTDMESNFDDLRGGAFDQSIDDISKGIFQFFEDGSDEEGILNLGTRLRSTIYELGTPRELLFGDVIMAVLRKKLENSARKSLPLYSGLPHDKWIDALKKGSFIKELWPAQHLLGKDGVLKGKSAVVQMPTSAGKTKAIELILRSAFLSERTSLAIIVAPFRALCHEIKNSLAEAFRGEPTKVDELSDAFQTDFEIAELLSHQQILVVTPEKLFYVLRHDPELALNVGVLVFDEGHQFDSGTRGITYELLLTSLRSMIHDSTQKVLISAVISNAESVGEWLNGESNIVVEGISLIPTYRSVGFASWKGELGMIRYVGSNNVDQDEFFVPRVIERFELSKKDREIKDRFFPKDKDNKDIALYLGLKLATNGGIAIFCGRKSSVTSICKRAVDIIQRGIKLSLPQEFSDTEEVARLHFLHVENLGEEASASKSAKYGIFSHHGDTPHGIRLAVEYAMRENLVRFVVCTSTLAQGVNLPIRYLIVTGVYQGQERIKVRDFHNLIGRAGRSGMHTEGSVLFANTTLYDNKCSPKDSWRWNRVGELLDPTKSEECGSSLLRLIPMTITIKNHKLTVDILSVAEAHIGGRDALNKAIGEIVAENKKATIEEVTPQVEFFSQMFSSIEGFLLSSWEADESAPSEADVDDLAKQTLAYSLADEGKSEEILKLFKILAENISNIIADTKRRNAFSKTLYGVNDAMEIETWVKDNAEALFAAQNGEELFDITWPIIMKHSHNRDFNKFDKKDVLKDVTEEWMSGGQFHKLCQIAHKKNCKLGKGYRPREVQLENIINIFEGGIAYDGALVISAVCEFVGILERDGRGDLINRLQLFQKCLKYGLPTETAVALYELGFSDRVISQDLTSSMKLTETKKKDLVEALKQDQDRTKKVMSKYPSYFQKRMSELLQQ